MKKNAESILRKEIFEKVAEYHNLFHKKNRFIAGKDLVNYGGRIYDEKEMINLVDSALEFWLTSGKYCAEFEKEFAKFLGIKYCSLVNSGSSANLLAFMALTSPKLGKRRIKPGDEVITVAAGFPTTVTPIIQYGATPVFIDVELPSYNIDCSLLDKALSKKTKAVMIAHTLGNPFNIEKVKKFCDKNRVWLLEDNCDSLGSRYRCMEEWKHRSVEKALPCLHASTPPHLHASMHLRLQYTGTFGDIGTSSFYPPHHLTMGEGGAVYTNNFELKRIIDSFRDWGRDCWCASGRDDTCGKRFTRKFGQLPLGYDHKYVYSHFGYNLKATEMQAAIGLAQLKKLRGFIKARKKNWEFLKKNLEKYSDFLVLPEPEKNSAPSWFGFLITVKKNAGFTRDDIVKHLETNKIQTRMLFAGNLIKHPCFDEMRKSGKGFRVVSRASNFLRQSSNLPIFQSSDLPVTDFIMNNTFWLGVYPGMDENKLKYIVDKFEGFFKNQA
ncbi:MAG: lipopolysaccharide biosynthesis protein RfbH [Elusimicrobia bacterium]|nr:lipopolysaccharide biosynthesis protein RfbH [Elusimicrobiota bacterium]